MVHSTKTIAIENSIRNTKICFTWSVRFLKYIFVDYPCIQWQGNTRLCLRCSSLKHKPYYTKDLVRNLSYQRNKGNTLKPVLIGQTSQRFLT